jgi:hypothetical protein
MASVIRALGAITQRSNSAGARLPAQLSNSFGACLHLSAEVFHCHIDNRVDDRLECTRIAIGQRAGIVLVAAAFTRHHVGRDGPGAACKAQHGRLRRQGRADLRDGVIDRRKALRHAPEGLQTHIEQAGRKRRTFTGQKLQVLTHRVRHDQDIGKQDRPIKAKPAQRLKRDLCSGCRIINQRQETAFLCAQFTILGQVAPGLPHQPDRTTGKIGALEGGEEGLLGSARHRNGGPIQIYRFF